MAQSVDDVLIGTGDLYIGGVGTDFPANPSTTPASSGSHAWTHLGIFRKTVGHLRLTELLKTLWLLKRLTQ